MRKQKLLILLVFAVLAMVSVASAALPAGPVHVNPLTYKGGPYYWDVNVIAPTIPELPAALYPGWCADSKHSISGPHVDFTAYSSFDQASIVASGMPWANWSAINYILNHKPGDWRITQAAIWHYDGSALDPYPTMGAISGYDQTAYNNLIKDVEANAGNSYKPPCFGLYAIVLYKPGLQVIFVEKTYECNVPEFPTLALPVAMMLGLVFTIHTIKRRKVD